MRILTIICAAALAVCAQTAESVNVRFASPFVAGETLMPAGDCNIQLVRGSSGTLTMTVRSASGPVANLIVTRIVDETGASIYNPHVVLRRDGDALHFERLLLADGTGFQVLSSNQ